MYRYDFSQKRWVSLSMDNYPKVKFKLEEAVEDLINRYFYNAGEYTIEKFYLTFCDSISSLKVHLENKTILADIYSGKVYREGPLTDEEKEAYSWIVERLIYGIERLYYRYDVFLGDLKFNTKNETINLLKCSQNVDEVK